MSNTGKELLLTSITRYFTSNKNDLEKMVEIINSKSDISLRLLDWFVTHYCKMHNVIYWIDDQNRILYEDLPNDEDIAKRARRIILHLDYRGQLKSYSKFYFDPFRRHNRITYLIDENRNIETTIGQLNFFRWVFKNKILDYVYKYQKKIAKEMTNTNNDRKSNNANKQNILHKSCYVRFD